MSILLSCPSQIEYGSLQNRLENKHNKHIDFLVTGVGGLSTLYSLCKHDFQKYDWILQYGLAGRIDPKLSLDDGYIVQSDTYGDAGVWEDGTFRTLFDLGFDKENKLPYQNGTLVNHHIKNISGLNIKPVGAVSVNQITTSSDTLDYFKKKHFQIETLEGAAFHYYCIQERLRFIQIRSISNDIGERNKNKWQFEKAFDVLANTLTQLLDLI